MSGAINTAWAAGLFEGEGSISATPERRNVPHGSVWRYIRLSLGSTDEDVVRRFHEVAGCGSVGGPYQYKAERKPHWQWSATGAKADAFLEEILPLLGERRQRRAAEVRSLVHG